MKVDVLTGVANSSLTHSDAVVAVDVLRSSTTILTALANGAEKVIPVSTVGEALKIGGKDNVLLGGEVNSVKPDSFQLGNSPLEYIRSKVEGRTIVLYTSSGTRLLRFLGAISRRVLIGAVVNFRTLADYLKKESFNHVSIITAGKIGFPAFEDLYCAGLIVKYLPCNEINREVEIVRKMAELSVDTVKEARHALELVKLGLGKDVDYCLSPNTVEKIAGLDGSKECIRLL